MIRYYLRRKNLHKQIRHYSRWLPALAVLLTGKDRHLPEIVWSDNSWVHNIFRVFEMIFWRRDGIRAESSVAVADGKVFIKLFTFEAACAHFEALVRNAFKVPWLDVKVEVLQLAIADQGLQIP